MDPPQYLLFGAGTETGCTRDTVPRIPWYEIIVHRPAGHSSSLGLPNLKTYPLPHSICSGSFGKYHMLCTVPSGVDNRTGGPYVQPMTPAAPKTRKALGLTHLQGFPCASMSAHILPLRVFSNSQRPWSPCLLKISFSALPSRESLP